ncbi:MAG: hypothetical protein K6A30_01045 [Lachnospiraceae bacterium]|nr:hypothetical protein [Lachnospiraceae bacterium]
MNNYREELGIQQDIITKLKKELEKKRSRYRGLEDKKIRVSNSNGHHQYYIVDPSTGKKIYAGKGQEGFVRRQVQREYEEKLSKKLNTMDRELKRFLRKYDFEKIKKAYENMPIGKKLLVKPLIQSDIQYIEEWLESHPGGKNPFPQEGKYQTVKGEKVRSKSEKIIADALERHKIPYQYEPLIELNDYHVMYPDFVALNIRTREQYYWEHLGLISDMEYATKNMRKMQIYEENGYLLGQNLIVTMESAEIPLQMKLVEEKIKAFLL